VNQKGEKIGSHLVQNQRRRQSASKIKIKSPPHEAKGKKAATWCKIIGGDNLHPKLKPNPHLM
jgi:hypothetical protein